MKKPSFLDRLTGSFGTSKFDEVLDEDHEFSDEAPDLDYDKDQQNEWQADEEYDETPQEGELPVDMYQTGDEVIIRALVAGVAPEDLEISITRDLVVIKGHREEIQEAHDDNYYHRELFWGGFSRSLQLPEEVIIDEAEAHEKHGLLEVRLPKVDKGRSTRLKVRSHTQK